LLPLVVFVAVFECKLSNIPNSYNQKKKNAAQNIESTEIIILGPSHAYEGINPQWLSHPALNMANSAQSLYYDKEILGQLLPRAKRLKVVLITISYFSMGYDFSKSDNWRAYFYQRYFGIPPDIPIPDDNFIKHSMIASYGQRQAWKYLTSGFKVNLAEGMNTLGWFDNSSRGPLAMRLDSNAAIVIRQQNKLINPSFILKNLNYLKKMITDIQSRGAIPVLLTLPATSYYNESMNRDNYQEMQNLIKDVSLNYKIKYLNYLHDTTFADSDFYDSNHLNRLGAFKISQKLDQALKIYLTVK